jgi:hypothetical protein
MLTIVVKILAIAGKKVECHGLYRQIGIVKKASAIDG